MDFYSLHDDFGKLLTQYARIGSALVSGANGHGSGSLHCFLVASELFWLSNAVAKLRKKK